MVIRIAIETRSFIEGKFSFESFGRQRCKRGPIFSRQFSLLRYLNKDDKELRRLGSILQQGKLGETIREKPEQPRVPAHLPLDVIVEEFREELCDSFDKIAYMSKDDVEIQSNFAKGRQFGSEPSLHFFDRKAAIRSLPDEVDVLSTPWEEIQRIYLVIQKLDDDKTTQKRVLERMGIREPDLMTKLKMGRNVEELCKAGRRGEKFRPGGSWDRVFRRLYAFNEVGFDRTLLGAPLRGGKHESGDHDRMRKEFPQEFIHDVTPFDTRVQIRKADVAFVDEDLLRECIAPGEKKPPSPEAQLRAVGRPLYTENCEFFRPLEHRNSELLDLVEKEVLTVKDALYVEIARKMIPSGGPKDAASAAVGGDSPRVRSSNYVVVSKSHTATAFLGPASYLRFKSFPLVPVCGMLLATRKHVSSLYRHLFKVFLVNVEQHVDVLMGVKYSNEADGKGFLRKLYARIHRCVVDKIMPKAIQAKIDPGRVDVAIYKPFINSPFSRLYWVKSSRFKRSNVRRLAIRLNLVILR